MLAKTTFLTHLLAIEYAENNIDKPLSTFALFILPYKCYACQVFSALVVSLFLAHILWGCFNIEIPSEMEVALRFTLFICLYVNKIGRAGWSPLTRAASPEGSLTMVWHLLQHPKIKIDMLDGREQTALQSSLMSGDLNVIRLLSTGSQTYINMRTQMRELEKELCSREDINVNRPGYADYIPLNYAQDDIKGLLQRVNQRRNQNNKQPGKSSLMMAENQSLYESDLFEAGVQVESILCRTYSM